MIDFATNFVTLAKTELARYAVSRAEALEFVLPPERLDEVVDNLEILQTHARIFLGSPLSAETGPEGEG